MELNVISFNIRCCDDKDGNSIAERAPRLHKIMSSYDPDVVCIQEFRPSWDEYFKKYFLCDYEMYNQYRTSTGKLESSPILWKKDKFVCEKRGTFWLSDTPEVESRGWDEKYDTNRICSYVILKEKKSGKIFAFMNTHFGFGDNCQTKSAKLICEYSKSISDYPTFCTGDFNMTKNSAGYKEITKYFTDANAVTANDYGATYHAYDPEKHNSEHIDFCFVDKATKPLTYKIIRDKVDGKFPSDHYGIEIKLEI